ncbi:hypothetical protein PV04_09052 [Phialophora macrospora]|uniref:Uncharacterized protein n=1 Tax=Phialophora macrospora TaxID=1851006 RepID=A0A0D2FVR6_9EURO|nr:hypothetical protein PV04_09052 [Phialophora macrospora]
MAAFRNFSPSATSPVTELDQRHYDNTHGSVPLVHNSDSGPCNLPSPVLQGSPYHPGPTTLHGTGLPSTHKPGPKFNAYATPFIPGAAQQYTTTILNMGAPEFVPGVYQLNNSYTPSSLNPRAEEYVPLDTQDLCDTFPLPPISDTQTVATELIFSDCPRVPVVTMPPSVTSVAGRTEGASTQSNFGLSSIVFEAQQDFDPEAHFKQRLEEEQEEEVAEDQAQRRKIDVERKVQRQVWLDGLDEDQWDNLARVHVPYHQSGEVNVDDMKTEKETAGLFYAQGFYYPTTCNSNYDIPPALIPLRDLYRFPLPQIEYQDCAPEYNEWKRGQQVLVRYDSHKEIEYVDPVTRKVQTVEGFGYDPWNRYKNFTKKELQTLKCAHHINFFGRAVPHRSGTSPATTIAILKSNPKNLNVTTPDGLWKSTIMECATQMLDPIIYSGKPEILDTLRGTDLEDACIGYAEIIYTSLGWWLQDTYTDEHRPVDSDALDPSTWPEGSIVMNGVTEGFASRLEIITSSTEEKKSADDARKAALQYRLAKGRAPSPLGMYCWSQEDITQELAFVPRPRTGLLTPSFPSSSSKSSMNTTGSVTGTAPRSATSNVAIASPSDRTPAVGRPANQPARLAQRLGHRVTGVIETRQEFRARVHAHDIANGLRPLKAWADEDEDDDNEGDTTEDELWRQRLRAQELQDGLGCVPWNWSDEFEPEHATTPTAPQPTHEDTAFQPAHTQGSGFEVIMSDFDRRLCESDAITGFQRAPSNWAEEVDGDEALASLTASKVEASIATVSTDVEVHGPVEVSPPVDLVEDADSNGHRRVSASSADSIISTSTLPTSPELDADDDINIIYNTIGNGGRYQPSLSKAPEPFDCGYIDDMDLDEEYERQHGEPLHLSSGRSNAHQIQAAVGSFTASSIPFPPVGLGVAHGDVVRIPGLELINEDEESPAPTAIATPQPQPSTLVVWTPPQQAGQHIPRYLRVVTFEIPSMIPTTAWPRLHIFGDGAGPMALPGHPVGLVRSPFMTFDVEDYVPDRVIEEIVGDEEEIDATVVTDNVTLSRDIHLGTVVRYNAASESTSEGSIASRSSCEASLSTPSTSAGSSITVARGSRGEDFGRPPARKLCLATTASALSSMATIHEIGTYFPPSALDQWPDFDSVRCPEIPERTSSLAVGREVFAPGCYSSSATHCTRGTFDSFDDDAGYRPYPVLPTFRRTRQDWHHASLNSVSRKLTKRQPAGAVTTNVVTTVQSRHGIMARVSHKEDRFFEFPESGHLRNGRVGSRTGQKTKDFFKKSIQKLKELLGKKN